MALGQKRAVTGHGTSTEGDNVDRTFAGVNS